MDKCCGITEIIGCLATGKTSLALHLASNDTTLYISPTIITHPIPSKITAIRIDSFNKLRAFIIESLSVTIQSLSAKCLIIDGLDNYMYSVKNPRKKQKELFSCVRVLRRLCVDGIRVSVVNDYYGNWKVEGFTISNGYLGLWWCYVPNRRYLVVREGEKRKVIGIGFEFQQEFIINDLGCEWLSK